MALTWWSSLQSPYTAAIFIGWGVNASICISRDAVKQLWRLGSVQRADGQSRYRYSKPLTTGFKAQLCAVPCLVRSVRLASASSAPFGEICTP